MKVHCFLLVGVVGATLIVTSVAGQTLDPDPRSSDAATQPAGSSLLPNIRWLREDNQPLWGPYASSEFRGGNHRVLADAMGFVPLYQDGRNLLFADIRGQFDDQDNREGNWGLGWRSILTDDLIFGGYGYYDHRWSQTGNTFSQITLGAELKTYVWDFRVNGYFSEQEVQNAGPSVGPNPLNPRAVFANNTIQLITGGPNSQQLEQAYSGVDFELGALLSSWGQNNDIELRSFAGGYYFGSRTDGLPTVMGPRARLELRCFDLRRLGPGSRLTIGAEYTWDEVRDSQINGIVRVQIPLNFFRQRRLNPFQRRMLDRVQRDVDIITQTGYTPERIEDTVYADTGEAVGTVSLADANRSLQQAVANAGPGGTVIVDGSRGVLNTSSTTFLQDGQTARGAGFQVRGIQTGLQATFGSRPGIVNSNPAADTLVVASGATVRDLDLIGGRAGISSDPTGGSLGVGYINSLNNSRIIGNRVSGAEEGFLFQDLNANSVVAHNQAMGNRHNGFTFANVNGGVISHNDAIRNGNDGFHFGEVRSGAVIDGNLALENQDEGFELEQLSHSSFSGNQAISNGDKGIKFNDKVQNGSVVSGNTANRNGGSGFLFAGIVEDSLILGNTANNNGRYGFLFNCADHGGEFGFNFNSGEDSQFSFNSVEFSQISGNTANHNGKAGFHFNSVYGSQIANNTANNNGTYGFRFNSAYDEGQSRFYFNSVEASQISGNTANHNVGAGFYFGIVESIEDSGSTANNNLGLGFNFGGSVHYSVLSNNTANGNGGHGFWFSDLIESSVSGNMARGNGGSGFYLDFIDATFTGNVAENNRVHGFQFLGLGEYGVFSSNQANRNGYDAAGNLLNADSNGFYFEYNTGTFTNNSAEGNANNGFAGPVESDSPDDNFEQLGGEFRGNTATNNGDKGYRGENLGGTVNNNTGSGNAGGGDIFP